MTLKKPTMLRMDRDLWLYARKRALDLDVSFNEFMNMLVSREKKNHEKLLTSRERVISSSQV